MRSSLISSPAPFPTKTGDPNDMGRFRVPMLRNLKVSAPYFHDGSAATLDDVLDQDHAGGRTLTGANPAYASPFPAEQP